MAKKYIVDLNKDENTELVSLTQKGRPWCQINQTSKHSAFG